MRSLGRPWVAQRVWPRPTAAAGVASRSAVRRLASLPAFLVVLAGIVPTFVWRALAEEKLLTATFAEHYTRYRKQTKMLIPRLL